MTGIVSDMQPSALFSGMRSGIDILSQRQDALQGAVSTGVKAADFAGLGASRSQVLSLQPAMTQVSAWSANIQGAQGQLTVTQSAMKSIGDISADLTKNLASLAGAPSAGGVASIAQQAKQSLSSLGSLLNTQYQGSYVFAGQNATIAPVTTPDLSSSPLVQSIMSLTGKGKASDILSGSLAATSDAQTSPFSEALSGSSQDSNTQGQQVITGANDSQIIGWVATQGDAATAQSTGSPIKDLIRNLSIIAGLGQTAVGSTNFNDLISGVQSSNATVDQGIANASAQMGVQQNSLTQKSSFLTQMSSSLTTQLGQARDADLAAVSTQLNDTQNQLQASYSIISDMKGMSLANYI